MIAIITQIREAQGKKDPSKTWIMGSYVDEKGRAGEFVIDKNDAPDFDAKKALSAEDLASIFKDFETSELQFDNNGRLTSLS